MTRRKTTARVTHVAGVGASAGGLEAMLALLGGLRSTGRIAYVLAQHMAHDGHGTLVARLLQRESPLPVVTAHDGQDLCADTVYLIPAGRDGVLQEGRLSCQPPHPDHLSTPSIDALLISLARGWGDRSFAIVLSGAGSDGLAGCRAVRSAGGTVLAQSLDQAKFHGMPGAVIEARMADLVLPAEAIGACLADRVMPVTVQAHATVLAPETAGCASLPDDEPTPDALPELDELIRQIRAATGIDFSGYKPDTLLRRLAQRKRALGIGDAAAYRALVRRDPEELLRLQQAFLVSLSSFFRDAPAFALLSRELALRLNGRPPGQSVRVWVPACASGEEVYTLAIVLLELDGKAPGRPADLLGTDLNADALQLARDGCYRDPAFREMPAGLRERHFIARGAQDEVGPALRRGVRFERRDVLADAPGKDYDLISCRNLLIYLRGAEQDRLIRRFHAALAPQGLLLLGQSESLSPAGEALFVPIDHYHRLFRRRP